MWKTTLHCVFDSLPSDHKQLKQQKVFMIMVTWSSIFFLDFLKQKQETEARPNGLLHGKKKCTAFSGGPSMFLHKQRLFTAEASYN